MFTVEEFAKMPRDEAVHFELADGELVPVSSGTPIHNWIRDELRDALRDYTKRHPIGMVLAGTDCQTTGQRVRRPDICFLLSARWELVDMRQIPLPFAPDIAVEILSPSESAIDVHRKVGEYLATGSSEVWVLDESNKEILVWTLTGAKLLRATDNLESPLLPGFSVRVADVLAAPAA